MPENDVMGSFGAFDGSAPILMEELFVFWLKFLSPF
jgi:hypothetical protein